jgi:ribosomal protein S18 acetylase RimI-like enzyme
MAASEGAQAWPIRRLQPGDAEAVAPLSVEAGWNQVAADWRLMLEQGRAFGIRAPDGPWVASALVLPLGPAIAWISMVLVTAAARRQGLGTRLLGQCLAEVDARGGAAGLDATEFGRPVYLPLGFRDVYSLSRWRLDRCAAAPPAAPIGIRIRPARPDDLPRIADFDRRCTGFSRQATLHYLLSRASPLACIAERADGAIAGYALGRDGHAALHVGPVLGDDDAIGLALLGRTIANRDRRVILDVPDQHREITAWLTAQGGSAPRGFARMLRGPCPALEDASRIFAVAGPELA